MLEICDLHVKFHDSSREAVGGVSYTIEDGDIHRRQMQRLGLVRMQN